jgi:hypothetical protein
VSKPALTRRQRCWYDEVVSCLKEKNVRTQFSYHVFCRGIGVRESWAWGAYYCAKKYGSRKDVDLKKLQLVALRHGSARQLYRYARDIPSANAKRFQTALVEIGDYHFMKTFSNNIPGANRKYLENLLIVMEVMDL